MNPENSFIDKLNDDKDQSDAKVSLEQNKSAIALNGVQKNIIEGTLHYIFQEIIDRVQPSESEELPSMTSYEAVVALEAMIMHTVPRCEIEQFKRQDIWDSIEQVRKIIAHPCPQNRGESYPYIGQEAGFSMFKMERSEIANISHEGDIHLKNSRIICKQNIIRNDAIDNYFIAKEPTGLLGLTGREDASTPPVTKDAVIEMIRQLVKEQIETIPRTSTSSMDSSSITPSMMPSVSATSSMTPTATVTSSSVTPSALELYNRGSYAVTSGQCSMFSMPQDNSSSDEQLLRQQLEREQLQQRRQQQRRQQQRQEQRQQQEQEQEQQANFIVPEVFQLLLLEATPMMHGALSLLNTQQLQQQIEQQRLRLQIEGTPRTRAASVMLPSGMRSSAFHATIFSIFAFEQPAYLQAMRPGANGEPPLFTFADIRGMNDQTISALIQPACLQAMRPGANGEPPLFTIADIRAMDAQALLALTQPACLQAMRPGANGEPPLFTIADIRGMDAQAISALTQPEAHIQRYR